MKRKVGMVILISILFTGTSALAGINTPFLQTARNITSEKTTIFMQFSPPTVKEAGHYVILEESPDMALLMRKDSPQLPYQTHVLNLPYGTIIEDIKVSISDISIMPLKNKIKPAIGAFSDNMQSTPSEPHEGAIYSSNKLYPSDWATHNVGVGLNGCDHVIFLSITTFPVRYLPTRNELWYINNMSIQVSYELSNNTHFQNDENDLVIIAPSEFSDGLRPLVEHKENFGLSTKLVTLDEIYAGIYFPTQGQDEAEQIKYFIKDAIEGWGTAYVLLVGGRHGNVIQENWWCPVRYSHLEDGSDEKRYLCDLYFSDIYKYADDDIVFDDWDSNGNGVHAEWRMVGKDSIDMYPDVYVGRLPCRNTFEVDLIVEKITTYETTTYGQTWFKKFVGVAGDTYPNPGDPHYEGELATEAAFGYLDGFNAEYLWTSTGTLSGVQDVISTVSRGCGFLHFSGHGNPMGWSNNLPNEETRIKGLYVYDMPSLSNKDMYPICIVGGCHNNQFNVSLLNLLKIYEGLQEWYYNYLWVGDVSPECWGWWLTRKINGGSIATIANSGYGYGQPGEDCLEYRGRYMELQFFKSYSEGKRILGETHASGLTYYLHKFPPLLGKIDSKIVQQWILLGDPSLRIGGYP